MNTLPADHRTEVLALFNNGDRLTEDEVRERLNDNSDSHVAVWLALTRLASDGQLRLADDDRWERHNPDLSNRPEWANRTDFDHDGTVLLHERELVRNSKVSISLVEEVDPVKQLLSFQINSWAVTFDTPEDALDAANALIAGANQWREIQAGDDL